MTEVHRMVRSPEACPDVYEVMVAKLHSTTRKLMDAKALPYSVQAQISAKGYVSAEDVADLYDDPASARNDGPTEWCSNRMVA
jgi:hypothetical protein